MLHSKSGYFVSYLRAYQAQHYHSGLKLVFVAASRAAKLLRAVLVNLRCAWCFSNMATRTLGFPCGQIVMSMCFFRLELDGLVLFARVLLLIAMRQVL